MLCSEITICSSFQGKGKEPTNQSAESLARKQPSRDKAEERRLEEEELRLLELAPDVPADDWPESQMSIADQSRADNTEWQQDMSQSQATEGESQENMIQSQVVESESQQNMSQSQGD